MCHGASTSSPGEGVSSVPLSESPELRYPDTRQATVSMLPPVPGIQHGLSPVVTAIRPHQLSARTVALPGQQVQAAAVTGLHADGPIGTQYLAQGTVAAWLAVPHTVLEGWAESKQGFSRQETACGGELGRIPDQVGRMMGGCDG